METDDSHIISKSYRGIRSLIAFAALLLVIGCANIIFGSWKVREYERNIARAHHAQAPLPISAIDDEDSPHTEMKESDSAPLSFKGSPTTSESNISERTLNQLHARIDFYRFVASGGRWLVAFSGVFILGALVTLRGKLGGK